MDAGPSLGCPVACPARHGVHLTFPEHLVSNKVKAALYECYDSASHPSAPALGRELAEKHNFFVTIRTCLPKGFHSLRHQYLLVQTQVDGPAIIVDVEFRNQFHYIGLPNGTYAACVAALPQLFIGTISAVGLVVSAMSEALAKEAASKHHDLPPGRSRCALFSNWLPEHFTDTVFAPPSACLHPVLLHTRHSQPAFPPEVFTSSLCLACDPVARLTATATAISGAGVGLGHVAAGPHSSCKALGCKRKAQDVAAGGGSVLAVRAHLPAAASQQCWVALPRAEINAQPGLLLASSALPLPRVVTGFSAPSSVASTATAGGTGDAPSRSFDSMSSSSSSCSSNSCCGGREDDGDSRESGCSRTDCTVGGGSTASGLGLQDGQ